MSKYVYKLLLLDFMLNNFMSKTLIIMMYYIYVNVGVPDL